MPLDSNVATLLSDNGGWNKDLIRANFVPADVNEILKIPVPNVPMRDKLLWHFNHRVKVGTKLR